jgi:hypothetical protein
VIEDFGLKRVPAAQACRFPQVPVATVHRALVATVRTAHKGVAHLTKGSKRRPGLEELHLGATVIPWLVCEHLYMPLGHEAPNYRIQRAV